MTIVDPLRTAAAIREAERVLRLYEQRKYGLPDHVALKACFVYDLIAAAKKDAKPYATP